MCPKPGVCVCGQRGAATAAGLVLGAPATTASTTTAGGGGWPPATWLLRDLALAPPPAHLQHQPLGGGAAQQAVTPGYFPQPSLGFQIDPHALEGLRVAVQQQQQRAALMAAVQHQMAVAAAAALAQHQQHFQPQLGHALGFQNEGVPTDAGATGKPVRTPATGSGGAPPPRRRRAAAARGEEDEEAFSAPASEEEDGTRSKKQPRGKKRPAKRARTAAGAAAGAATAGDDASSAASGGGRPDFDGERRLNITFSSLGSLGASPAFFGKSKLVLPDGLSGKFTALGQTWRASLDHVEECGQGDVRVKYSITNASGVVHSRTESVADAMRRSRGGRTFCNRVFREAVDIRRKELVAELQALQVSAQAPPQASSRACLEGAIQLLSTTRVSEGPLFFGLRHATVQQRMLKMLEGRGADSSSRSNSADPAAAASSSSPSSAAAGDDEPPPQQPVMEEASDV